MLGVNNDQKITRVKKAIKDNNLNWRSWYDGPSGPIVKDFGIRGFPTIFILDHNNVIRYKGLRGELLDQAIAKLVSEAEEAGMTGGSEPGAQLREFVDKSGKHKTKAKYTGFENGKVILSKEDESEVKVPWNRLCFEDQQYVAIQRLKEAGMKKLASSGAEFNFDDPFDFTDKSGEKSMKGTFMGLHEGKAVIWKTDGSQVTISFSKMSDESKKFAREEIKRMK